MAELRLNIVTSIDRSALRDASKRISKSLGSALKAGGTVAAGALGAVGAAAGAASIATINFADESNAAMEDFRQTTGISQKGVEAFAKSAKNIFAAGAGEGIEDIAQTMAEIANTTQLGAGEVEGLTKKALVLRDAMDKDVGESIDAVNVLMGELGLTSDEAFDFVTSGIQGGLDANGDFLDTIREYGNLFANAGFDAAQFYSILETGSEGGVLGTDKIADAVKEFAIIMNEGTADTADAFETVTGNSLLQVNKFIESGDETWADYFDRVIAGLQAIEDPLERNRLQVELFGTAAEDLGADFALSLSDSAVTLQEMAGAMGEVEDRNFNLGESMANLGRQLLVALEPAAQTLMPLLADGIRIAGEFLTAAAPVFSEFSQNLAVTLGPALQIIGDSLLRIGKALGLVSEDAENTDGAMQALATTLDLVVTAIEAVAVGISLVADAIEFLNKVEESIGAAGERAAEAVGAAQGQSLLEAATEGADPNPERLQAEGRGIFGFQGGGVVPGSPSQATPAILHGGEEVANPNEGQAVIIDGQRFAVREAGRLAAAINAQTQRNFQEYTNTLAEALG